MYKRPKRKPRFEQLMRPQNEAERREFRESVIRWGILTPVVIDQHGYLLDGHHRDDLAAELDLYLPVKSLTFPDDEAAEEWIIKNQLGSRNLSPLDYKIYLGRIYNSQKLERGRPENPTGGTADKIANQAGVSPNTVKRAAKFEKAFSSLLPSVQVILQKNPRLTTDASIIQLSSRDPAEQRRCAAKVKQGFALRDVLQAPKNCANPTIHRDDHVGALMRSVKAILVEREKLFVRHDHDLLNQCRDACDTVIRYYEEWRLTCQVD